MSLSPGTRLGAFEIVGPLGVGGMGEVYRARDSKLKREVAIKVLPSEVASDPERLARFQREAEVLASLNHPHIAQIFGVEEYGDQRALIMELVDGPTLRERISQGAIPFDEARPIAIQIADAVAFAHDHGVIHRDLKPANIKLNADGSVKVLDFGLAKALDPFASTSGTQANSPTITSPANTLAGTFLGTAAYMAPEQARGAVVDRRADVWAFGVVLFEMLTSHRLFAGETVSDTLANVLKTEPDWTKLPADTPASIRQLLHRCINKDRKHRLQDIGDARLELEEATADRATAGRAPMTRSLSGPRAVATFAAGAAVALLGAAAWSARHTVTPASVPSYTFRITQEDGVALDDPPVFSLSPDGEYIALKGSFEGASFIFVRTLSNGSTERLEATRGVANQSLIWSPDSKAFAFTRGNALIRINRDGSSSQRLFEQRAQTGSWTPEGLLLSTGGEVFLLNPDKQTSASVAKPNEVVNQFASVNLLPDGRSFVFTNATTGFTTTGSNIYLGTIDQSKPVRQLRAGVAPHFVPPDRLLAVVEGRLMAFQFDTEKGELIGEPQLVRDGVRPRAGSGGQIISVSHTGVVAIREDPQATNTQVAWFDRNGVQGSVLKLDHHCRNPEIAPDGARVALECYDDATTNRDIWVYDFARNSAIRLTIDAGDDSDPLWSRDGNRIVFSSNRRGPVDVFQKSTRGALPEELLFETPGATPTMALSPDGKQVAVLTLGPADLGVFDVEGPHVLKNVVAGPYSELEMQWSPDGRFFSYSSDESGRPEIYVQRWPQTGERWQVSTDGGTDVRWRPDGKELFYLSPTREFMAASIDAGSVKIGSPVKLFDSKVTGPLGVGHRFPYAVSPDGKRFLMYVSNVPITPAITILVNWPGLIRK